MQATPTVHKESLKGVACCKFLPIFTCDMQCSPFQKSKQHFVDCLFLGWCTNVRNTNVIGTRYRSVCGRRIEQKRRSGGKYNGDRRTSSGEEHCGSIRAAGGHNSDRTYYKDWEGDRYGSTDSDSNMDTTEGDLPGYVLTPDYLRL